MPSLVSIVVPICNEAAGLPRLADRLEQLRAMAWPRYELEIILVDDGSEDNSKVLARTLFAHIPRAVIASHDRNLGLGAAIRTGWGKAVGEIICTLDADCTYDPIDVLKLLEALEDGTDVATGSPYHPKGGVVNATAWRLALSRVASQLYRLVSGARLYTFTSLMRAYKRPVTDAVQFTENGFVSVAEILLQAIRAGYRVAEVPMVLRARASGSSKMRIARTITGHLGLMARSSIRPRLVKKSQSLSPYRAHVI